MSGTAAAPEGITNPPIDELLDQTDSKYSLVIYAAKRARQINAYYSQLGEGLLEYVGPLVETHVQEKPLSIALREINAGPADLEHVEPSRRPRPTVRTPVDRQPVRCRRRVRASSSASAAASPRTRRASCCAGSPSPATTSASCPTAAALHFVGAADLGGAVRQPGRHRRLGRRPRGAARAARPAGRPRRRRPGHRRPARQGRARPGRRPAHHDPAHRALPGRLRARDAHRDVGAPGHPGQRRHAARARRRRPRARRRPAHRRRHRQGPAARARRDPRGLPRASSRAAPRRARPAGRRVVVSAGGTREPLDPVRFLGNRSSGAGLRAGRAPPPPAAPRSTLVAANVALPDPAGAKVVRGRHRRASCATPCSTAAAGADAVVMAAAVADFRPADVRAEPRSRRADGEPRRRSSSSRNPDVLAELVADRGRAGQVRRRLRRRDRRRHGDVLDHGRAKLAAQGLRPAGGQRGRRGRGFESTDNAAVVLGADGAETRCRAGPKEALADVVWDLVARPLGVAVRRSVAVDAETRRVRRSTDVYPEPRSPGTSAQLGQQEYRVRHSARRLFTSESVTEGHPDKIADQISDARPRRAAQGGPAQPRRRRDADHHRPGARRRRGHHRRLRRHRRDRPRRDPRHRLRLVEEGLRRRLLRRLGLHRLAVARHRPGRRRRLRGAHRRAPTTTSSTARAPATRA